MKPVKKIVKPTNVGVNVNKFFKAMAAYALVSGQVDPLRDSIKRKR